MTESLFMAQYNSELEEFAENENSLNVEEHDYCSQCDCILRWDEGDICCSCEEKTPTFHWYVSQKDPLTEEVWEDYCDTEEEAMKLIEKAKKDGFEYEWAKYNDIEYPV